MTANNLLLKKLPLSQKKIIPTVSIIFGESFPIVSIMDGALTTLKENIYLLIM